MKHIRSITHLLLFCLIILGISNGITHAQNSEMLKTEDQGQDTIPLDQIPEEVIEEALALQARCESTPNYNEFLNCECLGAKMLDERLKQGPDADRDLIFMEIQKDCKDGTNAAGRQYRSCLGSGSLLPPGVEINVFCECYARTYAKFIEQTGSRVPRAMQQVKMQSAARNQCYNKSRR